MQSETLFAQSAPGALSITSIPGVLMAVATTDALGGELAARAKTNKACSGTIVTPRVRRALKGNDSTGFGRRCPIPRWARLPRLGAAVPQC